MSPRSFGIAILLHACLIGVALQQLRKPEPVKPHAAMSVTANVQAPSAMPQPQSSPAPNRAWPAPELELPGVVPAPDLEIVPEHEPEPVYEPQPEIHETSQPETRQPVTQADWKLREPAVDQTVVQPVSESADETTTTVGKPSDAPRRGKLEGFANPDAPPRILDPSWPLAVRERFDGTVKVKVVVGADGNALRVELVQGTGNNTWDAKMLETFKEANYAPGMHNGMVLITSHTFRVHFRRTR